jgi:hypothetical protein
MACRDFSTGALRGVDQNVRHNFYSNHAGPSASKLDQPRELPMSHSHKMPGDIDIFTHLDGTKKWYRGGKLHRDDGPAIEGANGFQAWYRDGKPHRDDGPAVMWSGGLQQWFLDGMEVAREDVLGATPPDGEFPSPL